MPHLRCIKPSISSSPPPQLNLLLSPPSFLPSLLKSCATHGFLLSGHIVHTHLVKTNLLSRPHIATALLSLYAKCSSTPCKAHQLFDEMRERCVVSWTALLSAHKPSESLPLFKQMCLSDSSPNAITMVTLLSSLAHHHFTLLECIHSFIIRSGFCSDLPVSNSLINIYSRCGDFVASRRVFDEMHERDLVSWNSIISGYSQNGDVVKVAEFLVSMRIRGMCPDLSTLGSLASAIGDMGRLDWGRSVHAQVLTCGFESDILVETALMDMYLRCGAIGFASSLFERMTERDLVAWNSMISGLVHNSLPIEALRVFYQMLKSWASFPSSATFASVLAACAQMDFGIEPEIEHYASIIDLLSRAGRVEEAYGFLKSMKSEPTIEVLGILLGACRNNGRTELAEVITDEILRLRPQAAEAYVQLAHGHAALSQWDGMAETLVKMRAMGLKKVPGWSFVQLNGTINTFFAYHTSHPQFHEIMVALKLLDFQMREEIVLISSPNL
ncbi:hypothetical protein AMTR_s00006p00265460 [Amborella trichopoda]|uniref:Pentacotripeptide-repeat region of PRORP domain-containing protein n=1 Tax=Amborella trichopoda TaxID=13333 RepID=W1PD48_AMBTC|nr:hypothetical protein AMTR_s00006p00265460 [Amborella trichopoda]